MRLKKYVFLFRNDGSMKTISRRLWQQVVDGKKLDACAAERTLKFAELQILFPEKTAASIRYIKIWYFSFDEFGSITEKRCELLPEANLGQSLGIIFSEQSDASDNLLFDYIDELCGVGVSENDRRRQAVAC